MDAPELDQDRLAAAALRVREAGALGRSDVLVRLFDFLLGCSMAKRAPKEVEIAQEVFGKGASFDMAEDASVRVYVHRLRRKLEEHYAAGDGRGDRLVIPRGAYRLVLTEQAEDVEEAGSEAEPPDMVPEEPPPAPLRPTRRSILAGAAAIGAINLAGWAIWGWRRPSDRFAAVANTTLWRPLAESDRPTVIAIGDYYIFGESPDTVQVKRLVREFEINSRDDLDNYLMANPQLAGRYVDLDLHYLPVSTAHALQTILPLGTAAAARGPAPLGLITMSELTPELLKTTNVIYLGFLSGLGLLRDPLFDISSFAVGASYDEIVDKQTNRRYVSDWSQVEDGGRRRRDYGYLASLPGPTGNRVLVIGGTRDAAVMQAAEAAADPKLLAEIAARTGGADMFEALYEVRTMGNLNLDSSLVIARPLRPRGPARVARPDDARFPDQMPR